jgi:hypothetical protein
VRAGWRLSRKRGGLEISFPGSIPRDMRAAIDAETADIARFEGAPVTVTGG